jgi:hypothetical protein
MRKEQREKQELDKNSKRYVYDLLGNIGEVALPHAKSLFVMAGQKGSLASGYFFEKDSSSFLTKLSEVIVKDESGEKEIGTLCNRDAALRAFHLGEPPEWLETGKKYTVIYPQTTDEDLSVLWDLRDALHQRLRNEGSKAAEEFFLIGTAIGGEPEDKQKVIGDIQSRWDEMMKNINGNRRKNQKRS